MHRGDGPPRHRAHSNRAGAVRARARHASARGEGFGRFTVLTVLALIPGAGLFASGRRRIGVVLIVIAALLLAVLGVFAAQGDVTGRLLKMAVRPSDLLVIAFVVGLVAIVWCVTIVGTAWVCRPDRPARIQGVLGVALVAALCVAVIAPSSVGVRYALIQRDLVTSLFAADGTTPPVPGGATPDVEKKDPWANVPRVNLLLLGSDAGADRTGVRTDSMMVASIDTATGDTVLFGLPRSLQRVPFPASDPLSRVWPNGFDCGDVCLLNAVWQQGVQHKALFPGDPNPGLTATRDVIGEILGLTIDNYLIIDLKGFQRLVDAMGGVTVNVPRRIPIGGGHNQATGAQLPIYGYIPAGRQHLNGYQALWFSRSRQGSDDYDRMRRQRCMVSSLLDQTNPVELLSKYPKLANVAKHNIQTDVRQSDLEAWVDLVQRIQHGSIRSLPFTNQVINTVHPDFAQIRRLVQESLRPSTGDHTTPPATATSPTGTTRPSTGTTPKPDLSKAQDFSSVC